MRGGKGKGRRLLLGAAMQESLTGVSGAQSESEEGWGCNSMVLPLD